LPHDEEKKQKHQKKKRKKRRKVVVPDIKPVLELKIAHSCHMMRKKNRNTKKKI